eukprot:symbB.v1.2.004924.t1/scaffold281.1/size241006/5
MPLRLSAPVFSLLTRGIPLRLWRGGVVTGKRAYENRLTWLERSREDQLHLRATLEPPSPCCDNRRGGWDGNAGTKKQVQGCEDRAELCFIRGSFAC